MPYEAHDLFTPPDDPERSIWRYVDFTKLVSLFETSALYFSRADLLSDAFEGSWPTRNVRARPDWWPKDLKISSEQFGEVTRRQRLRTYINCWNRSDGESAALWGIYVPPNGGVAIRSTFARLTSSFEPDLPEPAAHGYETGVFVGTVNYVDYSRETIPEGNALSPFVHKRRSFDFERELRAVLTLRPSEARSLDEDPAPTPPGVELSVNLETLVDEIRVSPLAPTWLATLVRQVCKRYGLDAPVVQSELSVDPVY
jgi:hypothetical protein